MSTPARLAEPCCVANAVIEISIAPSATPKANSTDRRPRIPRERNGPAQLAGPLCPLHDREARETTKSSVPRPANAAFARTATIGEPTAMRVAVSSGPTMNATSSSTASMAYAAYRRPGSGKRVDHSARMHEPVAGTVALHSGDRGERRWPRAAPRCEHERDERDRVQSECHRQDPRLAQPIDQPALHWQRGGRGDGKRGLHDAGDGERAGLTPHQEDHGERHPGDREP